ncbi:unnamed protein product [Adineta ricciae]|uniref:Uncharacterized protein n=1 Tax=Adineta ricciae TaxID=249248 RepID=A0A813YJ69_ADIRI|nr:unnamed protein product [Adineta ricciae]CAF1119488.1 unnamed protein product [Adineta ricciae]
MRSSHLYGLLLCAMLILAVHQASGNLTNASASAEPAPTNDSAVHKRQRRWGKVKTTVCGNGVITLANGKIICA